MIVMLDNRRTDDHMLCGALDPYNGKVLVDGISMLEKPLEAKRRIGLVHDNPELFNRLKAHEYLDFIADVFGRESPRLVDRKP